jgi:predicted AAA+ superfamily ATPase
MPFRTGVLRSTNRKTCLSPGRFFSSYIQTYVERDVRSLMNIKNITNFHSFLRLLAGRVGQLVNLSNISNNTGVSSTTVRSWIDILKASFMVIELSSYHENIRKRVVRSPKIYFTDTGLLCYLLGIDNSAQLKRDPLRGNIYENLVIMEVLKTRLNTGQRPDLYFYRDSNGKEVDLLIPDGRSIQPIEIKSSSTFTPDFIKGISSLRKVLGNRCKDGIDTGEARLNPNIVFPIVRSSFFRFNPMAASVPVNAGSLH